MTALSIQINFWSSLKTAVNTVCDKTRHMASSSAKCTTRVGLNFKRNPENSAALFRLKCAFSIVRAAEARAPGR